jgi:hypothetical protein
MGVRDAPSNAGAALLDLDQRSGGADRDFGAVARAHAGCNAHQAASSRSDDWRRKARGNSIEHPSGFDSIRPVSFDINDRMTPRCRSVIQSLDREPICSLKRKPI